MSDSTERLSGRHEVFAWRALLVFLSLGVVLEAMHGFKVGWYLDVSNEARRLQWTLAHTHGTLISLVNLAFAFSLRRVTGEPDRALVTASRCLIAAAVLMPAGFFLGGLITHAGDPGLGVVLVPVGALLLVIGVALAGRVFSRLRRS